jgi:hypothetical protein
MGVKMTARLFISFLAVAIALAGCAAFHPTKEAPPTSVQRRTEFGQKLELLMKEDEKTFDELSRKMNKYQDLLVLCESIAKGKEEGPIASACGPRLKALRQELQDLSSLLRGGK